MSAQLTIVIPIFNEAESLGSLEIVLTDYLKKAREPTKILFINDGSTDDSEQLIEAICETHSDFSFLSFTKNFGLSAALKAGFDHADNALIG